MDDDSETDDNTQYLAICIDAVAREVTHRRMSWPEAQAFVGGWLEIVPLRSAGFHGHMLLVDEEGLLKRIHHGFSIHGHRQVLMGNGVVFGRNDPELADCALPLETLRAHVRWLVPT